MKKILYFASMMLAVFMTYSCAYEDNPVLDGTAITIQDGNGNKYETGLVATFKGEVGEEVSLTLGVYDQFDIYGVDFGDGKIIVDTVCYQNGGLKGEDGLTKPGTTHTAATTFKGTVAGNGTVSVYGKSDIWYLVASNLMPTALDQEKLMNVVQLTISGANVESVELPAMEKMTQFGFTNSPVKSVDISKATALTRIDVYNSTQSKYEPQLKEIDLSKNVNLEMVVLGGSTYKKGELTKLDFTNNTKLTQISAENNKLTSVTGLPVSLKNLYLSYNELASLEFPVFTSKGTIKIDNNKFNLATLPTKPAITTASKYTYAPQPAYQVLEAITDANMVLDLSSQLIATGVESEPRTTTYKFVAGSTELKENEDYKVVAPGKFQFLKSQTEKVYGIMETKAFPKFTGKSMFVTTDFTVTIGASTPAEARTWDFTNWSAETVANLKADAATSIFTGWSDVEKDPTKEGNPQEPTEATKDNCFWLAAETTDANGKAIAELAGLQFDKDYCTTRSLAIAVSYPTTSLGTYAGASYLWLGGKNKTCFTIPGVKAGQKITMVIESHKASEGRGVEINGEKFTPTTKDSHTWEITADGDVVVKNTNGCHIYSIVVK